MAKSSAGRKAKIRLRLLKAQGMKCGLCGQPLNPSQATIDHIVPRSRGGPDVEWNMHAAHAKCNGSRGRKPLDSPAYVAALIRCRQMGAGW